MPGIKVLLVEDDWIIAREISYSLQDLGFEVAGIFDTGEEALKQIELQKPDLIILDIDLSGEITGIDVAKHLKKENSIPFIFLTALADTATIEKAKLAEPYAYLVKPVTPETLYSTIEITLHNASRRHVDLQPSQADLKEGLTMGDGIFVKTKKRLEKIMLSDILYIEAFDIYAMIKTSGGQYLLSQSLKSVEEKFPSAKFIRVHRSYLVNIDKIEAIEENDLIISGMRIPIGKTYREQLMNKLSFL